MEKPNLAIANLSVWLQVVTQIETLDLFQVMSGKRLRFGGEGQLLVQLHDFSCYAIAKNS